METALQKQLAQIAQGSKSSLNAKAQKSRHSKSLIWDPKVAATQSFQKIYPVCREGFDELCGLDNRFAKFRATIFSEQSQDEDRTQLTEDQNALLDAKIESFLRLVGSRLHLMPAVKAVEWLIRRFRIHENSTTFLLTTFLPWHTLPVFTTLLSITPLKGLPDEFKFLDPYIRSLTAPARQALVHEAIQRRVFLVRISEYALESCRLGEHYDALIKFWSGIFTEAVAGLVDKNKSGRAAVQSSNDQHLLSLLVPICNQALSMKKVPDVQIGAYMAVAAFVSKARLSDAAVTAFMEEIALRWTAETVRPGLVCLAILSQHRSAKQVPKSIAKALLKISNVEKHLVQIGREYQIDRFVSGLCLALVDRASKRGDPRGLPIVATLLKGDLLTVKQISVLFKSLLLAGTNLDQSKDDEGSVRRVLGSMLVDLARDGGACGSIAQKAISDVDFDIEALEMKLDLSLRPNKLLAAPSSEDVAMTDDVVHPTPVKQDQLINDALKRLSAMSRGLSNSLSREAGPAFEDTLELFLGIVVGPTAEQGLAKMENLGLLRKESIQTDCTCLAFYMRIWNGPYPALARTAALDRAVQIVKHTEGLDFQALLPYAIAALRDPSKNVRQNAANLIVVLSQLYDGNSPRQRLPVWGKDSLYDEAKTWESLKTATVVEFLGSFLLQSLEECILDPNQILHIFERALAPQKSKETGDKQEAGRLSQSARLAILTFLASHILHTPILGVKERLLRGVNIVRTIGSTTKTQLLLPALSWWAGLMPDQAARFISFERLGEADVNQTFANVVVPNDVAGLQTLLKLMGTVGVGRQGLVEAMFGRMAHMWETMKPENKTMVADRLLELALARDEGGESNLASAEAAELLRTLSLGTEILAKFLDSIHLDSTPTVDSPPVKRRRLSNDAIKAGHNIGSDVQAALSRATFVLQLVEVADATAHTDLVPALFSSLATLHQFRRQVGSDLGYLQNVVLTSLLSMLPDDTTRNKLGTTVQDSYGDTLVKCIQKSPSPVVQNSALLLIAKLAKIAPAKVIRCVMPTFTAMGVSVIRQKDDFSAHVVNEVIREVMPPLLESLRKDRRGVMEASSELLRSFTSAYEHIPAHRKHAIFVLLAETMGVDDFLFAIVALLLDTQGPTSAVLVSVRDLMDRYKTKTQLHTIAKMISLMSELYKPEPNLATVLFDHSEGGERDIILSQLTALPMLLSSRRLMAQTRKLTEKDDMEASEIRELYAGLLEKVLDLANTIKTRTDRQDLYSLCGESLASLLHLLTIGEFIKAVENLLDRPDIGLRQKVLKALETRVSQESKADANSRAVLLGFLPQLTAAIRDSDDIRYKYTAVTCVDKIAEKYGERDIEAVSAAAATIAGESCLGQSDKQLRTMALLCLASLVDVLDLGILTILPSALKYTTTYLRESLNPDELDGPLYCACYTFVSTVGQQMPDMIPSSTLEQLLAISHSSVGAASDDELAEARISCLKCLATRVEAKTFFTALGKGWNEATSAGLGAVMEFLELLRTGIAAHRPATIVKNVAALAPIFFNTLDFRRQEFLKGPVDESHISDVEETVNDVAIKMICKLNNKTLSPIFSQLMEWTATGLPKSDAAGRLRRSTGVYKFLLAFFAQLGRVVTDYGGHVLDDAARLLKHDASPRDAEGRACWESVLRVLAACFEHDEDGAYWQAPARFDVAAPLLVGQLRHAVLPGADVAGFVNPAVAELARAAAVPSDAHRKDLNALLLPRLRAPQPSVRLAAVRCERLLAERLGEEWLASLPEMLPYISELQEDDDDEVERETHAWIGVIEGVLGEPLDAMLQ